jgi:hypothetical protein
MSPLIDGIAELSFAIPKISPTWPNMVLYPVRTPTSTSPPGPALSFPLSVHLVFLKRGHYFRSWRDD